MTWEETIKYIRTQPKFKDLVKFAYFEEDLKLNVERFKNDEEFVETKRLIKEFISFNSDTKLLDIGSGNGITALAFALSGIQVVTVEPDPSETIGAGAIRKLKTAYNLSNLEVYEGFAEELNFADNSFDIVYTRQCMHHAHNLPLFIKECFRVLKKGGLLITVRDHVIFNERDKAWFLETHPLQEFYGGENAYTENEYRAAMIEAGFKIQKVLKYYDNVINHFPLTSAAKNKRESDNDAFVQTIVKRKLGALANVSVVHQIASKYVQRKLGDPFDETKIPGRMYTFMAIK